ncbi:MAG: M4 family metallopeptidase [Bacteroidales bacterium]|nr:M4 family metallopeptidase [Bacteroidales bacterium]
MKQTLLVLLSIFLWQGIMAQSYQGIEADKLISDAANVRIDKDSKLPTYIEFKQGKEIDFNILDSWLKRIYKLPENCAFIEIDRQQDQIGYTHIRYRQTVNNIIVRDAMFMAHIKGNKVYSINGIISPLAADASTKSINEAQALKYALAKVNAKVYKWEIPVEEQWIKHFEEDVNASFYPNAEMVIIKNKVSNKYRLSYKFDVYAHEPLSRANIYIDAQNGAVLFINDKIHHSDSVGTASTKFSGSKTITTDYVSAGSFRLRETGRGNGIETYDMNNGTSYGSAVDFTDTDNNWNNVNANQDEVATDAHWGMEMTYDYYWNKFNRNSIDGNGFALKSYVHYSSNYVNAYWNGQVMTFGDGNSSVAPLVSIDIVGHEITHGLTSHTADLDYQDESGAMNEAYSDIFGTAIEHYGKTGNWTLGEDIGMIMRSMSNPKQYNDPDTYLGTNYYLGTADNGGVHTNSGVLNHWFYLATDGGTGINDNLDTFTVVGVGIDTAAAVAFRTLTVYLTNTSQYADARFYSIKSAMDLYGPCSPAVAAVTNAFYAVGIGAEYVNGVHAEFTTAFTEYCAPPAEVKFENLSSNAITYKWYFGDGNTSTQFEPTHTYTNFGTYNVKLVVDGGTCGSDSLLKPEYISVDTANPCMVIMPPSGSSTVTGCAGYIFDEGGNSDYSNSTSVTTTIAPVGASSVTLTFSTFGFEASYDYLKIYNGTSTSAPLIGSYDGNQLPNGGIIVANSGAITLHQITDNMVTDIGFAASWQCAFAAAPPVSDFLADDTLSCVGTVNFTDISSNGPTTWYWEFGDGNTSTQKSPTHTYSSNGYYDVKLIATNSYGFNTIIKNAYIHVVMPNTPYAPNMARCNAGTIQLHATGNGLIKWYNSQSSQMALDTGSYFTTPNLSQSASYWVENIQTNPTINAGKLTKTGPGSVLNANQALIFDVYKTLVLDSVTVYATSAGSRTITLKSSSGTTLESKTVNVINGETQVYLGFVIPQGTDYELGGKNLFRNNAGANYPYTVSGLLSINRSSAASNPLSYYYYFFNWKVQKQACASERVEVHAYINSAAPTANFVLTNNDPYVDFSDQSTNPGASSWDFGDGGSSALGQGTHLYLQNGTYTVTLNVNNGCGTDTKTKTVTIGSATSIKHATEKSNIKLYPNPTNGKFTIDLGSNSEYKLISIYDFMGKLVIQQEVEASIQKIQMNANNLSSGMYLIRLSSDDKYEDLKLMITPKG